MTEMRVMLAVDASNLYRTLSAGQKLDYRILIAYARQSGTLEKAAIYVPSIHSYKDRGFLYVMQHIGFDLVVQRQPNILPNGRMKSDLDVSIVLDIWDAVIHNDVDHVILCTGDSDVIPLVERIKAHGTRVSVVGPWACTSQRLRAIADDFSYTVQIPGLIRESNQHESEYSGCSMSIEKPEVTTYCPISPHIIQL